MTNSHQNIRKLVRYVLSEGEITPPSIPNTMNFWHGGNLDEYSDVIAQKSGRYEYGAGLYLITRYDIAHKYSKGSRKLYLVTVEKGINIDDAFLNMDKVLDFIKTYVIGHKKKEILERFKKHIRDNNTIPAYVFNNIILNEKAIKSTNTKFLRNFLVENGVDYELVDNAFGFGETMMVLYNMKKVVNTIVVRPGDDITVFNLKNN